MNILIGLILTCVIIAIPIFMQRTTYQSIDERKFKKYKIKKIGFLFRGMQGESASSCGVILPMLIIQIQGYVIGLLAFIFVIFNEIFHILPDSVLVLIITLFIHSIVVVFISIITGLVSKIKK